MPPPLRSQQRALVTVMALLLSPVFMFGPAALGLWLFTAVGPSWVSLAMLLLFTGGSGFFAYHMLQNNHWVEFDGSRLRARRFWTRQLVEQAVEDVVAIRPVGAAVRGLEATVTDMLVGSVRGYEIRFRTGPSIALVRYDMTRVDELVQAVEQASVRPH